MARYKTSVELSDEERERLERVARTRTAQAQTVGRARMLLLRDVGETLRLGYITDGGRDTLERRIQL